MDKKWSIYLVLVCLVLSVVTAPVNATTNTKTNTNTIGGLIDILMSYDHKPANKIPSNITISTNSNFKFTTYLLGLIWINQKQIIIPLFFRWIWYDLFNSTGNIIKHGLGITRGSGALFKIGKLPKGNYTLKIYYKGNIRHLLPPCKKSYNLSVVG